MTYRGSLLVVAFALSCSSKSPPAGPLTVAKMPDIDAGAALGHIERLASDEFEGRAPGTRGEELTVAYLSQAFAAAGLQPGNPDGSWIQKVPLVGLRPSEFTPLVVKKSGQAEGEGEGESFAPHTEVVAYSQRVAESIALADSEVVFVGYGVQAPEFRWDDYKGVDVKGKTLVMLVNDPPVADANGALDPGVFGGKTMTYYGRWTYKYDKAAELGAAAVLVVHEVATAGYPFKVVQGFGGERFDLVAADKNMGRAAVQGWLSREATVRMFEKAGLDYEKLKAQAATREFTPVSLGMDASMSFKQTARTVDSRNVIAKLPGSDPAHRDEYVIYTAHWDHLGVGEAKDGDRIHNGASDNASGTSALVEIARAMAKIRPAPRRTILFLAVTAEEQGLLGSEYYAQNPLYPLEKTLANLNTDNNLPMWGRTKDVIVIGLGASDLDDYLRDAAAEQGRELKPDAEPEKGFYYRSDHFNFARAGVPALAVDDGTEFVDKPAGFGRQKKDYYLANDYHSPSDEVKPDWDLTGYAEQAKLLMAVGYRVAEAERYPEWKPDSEFRAAREKQLKK